LEKCTKEKYKRKVEDAIKLEKKIFGNAHTENEYYDNMKRGLRIEIIYADIKQNEKVSSYPCAFIALFNRVDAQKITRHIWLYGVLPEMIGKGLMKSLFSRCFSGDPNFDSPCCSDEREYDKTDIISVHTYPDFYKEMFCLIKKYGFIEEKELVGKYKGKGRFVRYVTTFAEIRKIMNSPSQICLLEIK
jgi:hypothetical protein